MKKLLPLALTLLATAAPALAYDIPDTDTFHQVATQLSSRSNAALSNKNFKELCYLNGDFDQLLKDAEWMVTEGHSQAVEDKYNAVKAGQAQNRQACAKRNLATVRPNTNAGNDPFALAQAMTSAILANPTVQIIAQDQQSGLTRAQAENKCSQLAGAYVNHPNRPNGNREWTCYRSNGTDIMTWSAIAGQY